MSVFDDVKGMIIPDYSDWVMINDPKSDWTIEDFPYETGVDENLTRPHCWKCVSVNHCWFKDIEGKRPQEFDYSKYSLLDLPLAKRGLYHPNCHDQKIKITTPRPEQIKLIILPGKIRFFFIDKLNWYHSWGYTDNDKNLFINTILQLTKKSFSNGNYEIENHTKYGVKINLFFELPGINEKKNRFYKTWSNFMIFPNGKLKINTLIGGKNK